MKGRSHHRLPISDPPDDWGDGSWTVDCICGVTYDDGEEMVNCDECGVWVHTRCCRFVKGETSFACDKCKSKRGRSIDNSEETEVAQLLVELPNKTVHVGPPPPQVPPRPPFRLWTDIPIEERVHVQGVPGGDPDLFQNLSPVFTSQLWKCTGYVPKKFNLQYKEFPCWEEEEKRHGPDFPEPEEANESPADRGADVLFSLSNSLPKEIIPYAPSAEIGGLRALVDGVSCESKLSPKDKRWEGAKGSSYGGRMHNSVKEKNQLRPVAIQLGKRKKDEPGGLKERSGKKKPRGSEKEADNRKRGSTPAGDAHVLEFCEGSLKVADFEDLKNEDQKENIHAELTASFQLHASDNDLLRPKMSVTPAVVLPIEVIGHTSPPEELIKAEKIEQEDATNTMISPSLDALKVSVVEADDVTRNLVKEEDGNTAVDGLNHVKDENHNTAALSGGSSNVAVDTEEPKPPSGDLGSTQDVQGICLLQKSNVTVSPISLPSNSKAEVVGSMLQKSNGTVSPISLPSNSKAEVGSEAKEDSGMLPPPVGDEKLDPARHLSQCSAVVNLVENLHSCDAALSNSLTGDLKAKYAEREPAAAASCLNNDTVAEGIVSTLSKPYQCRQESVDSTGPLKLQEVPSKSRHSSKYVKELLKPGGMKPNPPTPPSLRRLVGVGKSSSASSTIAVSKSSVSVSYKSVAPPASQVDAKHINFSKQRLKVKSSTDRKKDNSKTDTRRDENKQEVPRAPAKDRPKSPSSSGFKTSQPGRSSQSTSVCNLSSDAKEQVLSSSSKASATQVSVISSGSVDHANSLQAQAASQGKHTASSSCQKSEKISQSSSQSSSKVFSHSPSMHPPANVNSSAALSDEELALLLHQELNSSPRVPRVPRVRHASSIPQLASPTATSMLAKRPSFSGGKDHISVSRRKTKEDACKDNSRNSREQVEESRKLNRLPPSPDCRRPDSAFTTDGLSKKDALNRSSDAVGSAKKAVLAVSTDVANLPSSVEVNDQNPSSIRSLPRDISDDDTGGAVGLTPRTLPVLIAEIMSKGKRTTYQELCDAVLPHWNNLRKHNGERYAYSSHSQAVLDCLRNRNEWAHLIDRGPKTNSSRKRRKPDADPPAVESEDEDDRDGDLKHEGRSVKSNQEDVPKGKRKARKRRRLTLQGRGLKEVRKRQKAEAELDEDFGVFSHSSEGTESIFSEDESQGGRTDAVSEASTSSSDDDGMM